MSILDRARRVVASRVYLLGVKLFELANRIEGGELPGEDPPLPDDDDESPLTPEVALSAEAERMIERPSPPPEPPEPKPRAGSLRDPNRLTRL